MKHSNTISINASNDDDGEYELHIRDTAPTPDEYAEHNETQRIVRQAISELSAEYKEVITLCDVEDMSYDDISLILKCPVGTVKSRLNRARKALRKKLSENRELFM